MKHNLSFLIILLILLTLAVSSGLAVAASTAPPPPVTPVSDSAGPVVVRVYYDSVEDIGRLVSFDVFEYNNTEAKYVLAAVDDAGLRTLQDMGFRAVVDSQETANFAQLSVPLARQAESVGIASIPGYTCYRTVEETYAAAAAIAANHPTLATWTDVGDSWEKSVGQSDGYDIMVLKLTNSTIAGDKPKLFITAAIHAREYTTAELATRFAEYLVNNYGTDADATWILDHHEVHLILQMNPDGRKEAEAGSSWRKNTNENYCGATSVNRGADLNRNYSFYWNYCSGCSSGTPCDLTYRGPSAGSEPETQAVQNYLLSIFPDQRDASLSSPAPATATGVYIDLHSYSQLVLWPWGFTTSVAPNSTALQTLGRKFAYFNSYTPEQAVSLYATDGTTDDFAYGNLGVAAYTFEMGTAFFQACSTFENTIYPTNLNALIYAAKVVRTPYQTPAGPDALSLAGLAQLRRQRQPGDPDCYHQRHALPKYQRHGADAGYRRGRILRGHAAVAAGRGPCRRHDSQRRQLQQHNRERDREREHGGPHDRQAHPVRARQGRQRQLGRVQCRLPDRHDPGRYFNAHQHAYYHLDPDGDADPYHYPDANRDTHCAAAHRDADADRDGYGDSFANTDGHAQQHGLEGACGQRGCDHQQWR